MKRDLVRYIFVGILTALIFVLFYILITLRYYTLFKIDEISNITLEDSINHTIRLTSECENTSDYRRGNLIFAPVAIGLVFIFSCLVKRTEQCTNICNGRPGKV